MNPVLENHVEFGPVTGKGFYVPNGTQLIVSLRSSVDQSLLPDPFAVTVRGTLIRKTGAIEPFAFKIMPIDGARTLTTQTKNLQDCYIQSVNAFVDPTFNLLRGQIFVSFQVQLTFEPQPFVVTLAADYIEASKPVSYPESGVHSSTEGRGYLQSKTFAQVNGAPLVFTALNHLRILVRGIFFTYSTVGGGAAQTFLVAANNNTGPAPMWQAIGVQPSVPGAAVDYTFGRNYPPQGSFSATVGGRKRALESLPQDTWLWAGETLTITPNTSPQAGDAMNPVTITTEEWIEPRTATNQP